MFELFNPRKYIPTSFKALMWVALGWLAFVWFAVGSSAPSWV